MPTTVPLPPVPASAKEVEIYGFCVATMDNINNLSFVSLSLRDTTYATRKILHKHKINVIEKYYSFALFSSSHIQSGIL